MCRDAGSHNSRPSGRRVSSSATVEALKAFTCLVTTALGDAHACNLAEREQAEAELSAEGALTALQKLAVQQCQQPQAHGTKAEAGGNSLPVSQLLLRLLLHLPPKSMPKLLSRLLLNLLPNSGCVSAKCRTCT